MEEYYDNDFWSAVRIAFDDPTLAVDALIDSIFDISGLTGETADPAEVFTKNSVAECLADTIEDITNSDEQTEFIKKAVNDIISKIDSSAGLSLSDYVNTDEDEKTSLSTFKDAADVLLSETDSGSSDTIFSDMLDVLSKVVKTIDKSSDLMESALTDYAESYIYLEAFEAALNESGLMNDTLQDSINRLKYEYNEWFVSGFADIISDAAANKAAGLIASAVGKSSYGFVTFVWDALNEISGNADRAELLKKTYAYMIYSLPLCRSYTYYADKILSGYYSAQDVLQCEKVFELCKQTRINEYTNVYELEMLGTDIVGGERFNSHIGMSEESILRQGIEMLKSLTYEK